ncbi:hypothetical protein BJX65DRAFT_303849 [Aspergillus insuetus]
MRDCLPLLLVAAFTVGVNGWYFPRPCEPRGCPTDAMTVYWTIEDDEYINQFTLQFAYKDRDLFTQRMVQLIQTEVQVSLTLNRRPDLLVGRQAIFIEEDAARLNGATSTSSVTISSPGLRTSLALKMVVVKAADLELKTRGLAPRYNFCLFVHEICLESLDYMSMSVVKVLCRFSGVGGRMNASIRFILAMKMGRQRRMWDGCIGGWLIIVGFMFV